MDSVMALVISMAILSTAIYLLSEPAGQNSERLYQASTDLLSVAGEKGVLQGAVNGDVTGVENLKAAMPPQLCFRLDVKNESDSLVFSDGSICPQAREYAIGKRTFTSNSRFYTAEMRVWLK